ncbi:MAG: hypothetical protein J5746_12090 [Victivallales bacterium]|nr:hypothetical protein [Victivallales bacterium]
MLKKSFLLVFAVLSFCVFGNENLLKNPSFEEGMEGWVNSFSRLSLITGQIDEAVFASGQKSLKILGEPDKVANIQQTVKLPAGLTELTFAGRIKTTGIPRGWCASMHLSCYGDKNKKLKEFIKGTSWQKPENDWLLCGGNVKLPEGTIRVVLALRVHNANNYKGKPDNLGTVWFDDLGIYAGNVPEVLQQKSEAVHKPSPIKVVEAVKLGGVFLPGEQVEFKCVFDKQGRAANYTVLDFYNKKVLDGKVDDKGKITFKAPEKNGYYIVKVNLTGGQYGERTGAFIVAEKVEAPDPFFEMCHHYITVEFFSVSRALGYGSITVPVLRYKSEPKPGQYDFTYPDKLLAEAEKCGMVPRGHLSLSGRSSWALPAWLNKQLPDMMKNGYTEEYFQQTRDYVHACLQHYGNKMPSWMVSGEINLTRRLSPYFEDCFFRNLQIVHDEVKAFNPNLKVASMGVAGVDYPSYAYLKYALPKTLQYMDIVAPDWYVSPYVYGPGFRPVSEEKGGFREQILDVRKLVGDKELAIAEKGYGYVSTIPFDHQALKDNAANSQRGMIIAKALGIQYWVPHYGVAMKESKNYDMGMWLKNNPRPILASTAAIARLLCNARDAVEFHPSPEIWGYIFKKNGKIMTALWQSSSEPVVETSLVLPKDAVCYDIMGNPCEFNGSLSGYPIFIESSESQKAFLARLKKGEYQLPAFAAEYQFASTTDVRLVFRNLKGDNVKIRISNPDAGAKDVELPVGDSKSLHTFPFHFKKAVGVNYSSNFTFEYNGKKTTFPVALKGHEIRFLKDVKLDGSLKSFEGVEPILMDNSSFLHPVDAAPNGLWTGKDDLSAKIYLGYDEKFFYIGTEITDDQWFFTKTDSMLWNQDAIEISIDPLNNALSDELKTRGYDADDLDISFGQSAKGPAAWCHLHPDKAKRGDRSDLTPVINKKSEHVMVVEFRISWEELGLKPEKGTVFGFNLAIFDRESATGSTAFNMALTNGTTGGKDPSCYRKFVLSGAPEKK